MSALRHFTYSVRVRLAARSRADTSSTTDHELCLVDTIPNTKAKKSVGKYYTPDSIDNGIKSQSRGLIGILEDGILVALVPRAEALVLGVSARLKKFRVKKRDFRVRLGAMVESVFQAIRLKAKWPLLQHEC